MYIIAGYGFVGKAYFSVFKDFYDFVIVDPKYNNILVSDFTNPTGILCCVPTPSNNDGSCDISAVLDVIEKSNANTPILIKSTIDLEGWKTIFSLFPNHNISFSPEFLRANTANEDLEQTSRFIIANDYENFWHNFYSKKFKHAYINHCTIQEAIIVKYFVNSYLATKVSFFNQVFDFCNNSNINYNVVRNLIAQDTRIGESHTYVNKDRGWGGHCFPKDTSALIKMSQNNNTNLSILESAVDYNLKIRNAN